jgi:hypothetical protein
MTRGRAALVLALAWCAASCSTTYQPRPSARVGAVIHHGVAMYVKNGHEVPIGPFSSELESLMTDTPAAAAVAHTAHRQLLAGIPLYLVGLGGVVVGIALFSGPVGWVLIGVGSASTGSGLGLMGCGFTNAVDAVNIHNDAAPTDHASR